MRLHPADSAEVRLTVAPSAAEPIYIYFGFELIPFAGLDVKFNGPTEKSQVMTSLLSTGCCSRGARGRLNP